MPAFPIVLYSPAMTRTNCEQTPHISVMSGRSADFGQYTSNDGRGQPQANATASMPCLAVRLIFVNIHLVMTGISCKQTPHISVISGRSADFFQYTSSDARGQQDSTASMSCLAVRPSFSILQSGNGGGQLRVNATASMSYLLLCLYHGEHHDSFCSTTSEFCSIESK